MTTKTHNLVINRGDSYELRANLTIQLPDWCVGRECSIVPNNLTDLVVKATIKATSDACMEWPFSITIDNPVSGVVDLFLSSSESMTLKAGKDYIWDLRIENPAKDTAYTAFRGSVKVIEIVSE